MDLETCDRCGRDLVLKLNRTAHDLHGSLSYVLACLICGFCAHEGSEEVCADQRSGTPAELRSGIGQVAS